mmetsp:Transcript_21768/g.52633  ORF Transcript_21768/g.52633 Transcript_21768/m.52633 type:complete len:275 (-) Transcript_21768:298-1122(-)
MTPAEFLLQYLQSLTADAERRIHRGIRRRDHRRDLPHRRGLVGIPNGQTELGVVGLREHYRIRPPPRLEDQEELAKEARGTCVGVQLQDERHGHVDVHAPPVSHLVRVESAALGPFTYESDHRQEGLVALIGAFHEGGDEVRHAGTVQALLGGRVDAAQDHVVVDVEVGGYRRSVQPGEEQVDIDPLPIERQDGNSGIFDGYEVGNIGVASNAFGEGVWISLGDAVVVVAFNFVGRDVSGSEEVFSRADVGSYGNCVDIRPGLVHAQPIAPARE